MLTKQTEFEFIQAYSTEFSLSILFKLTSVSRAGYYKWKKRHSKPLKRVGDMGLIQSMSRRGNCWDNACIENFFRHIKAEMPHFGLSETLEEVSMTITEYIH